LPALTQAAVSSTWAGDIDSPPDGTPGICELPGGPGLILAAGFSGHGFGIGPGASYLLADLVTGQTPFIDQAPYHPDRVLKGAKTKVAKF